MHNKITRIQEITEISKGTRAWRGDNGPMTESNSDRGTRKKIRTGRENEERMRRNNQRPANKEQAVRHQINITAMCVNNCLKALKKDCLKALKKGKRKSQMKKTNGMRQNKCTKDRSSARWACTGRTGIKSELAIASIQMLIEERLGVELLEQTLVALGRFVQ